MNIFIIDYITATRTVPPQNKLYKLMIFRWFLLQFVGVRNPTYRELIGSSVKGSASLWDAGILRSSGVWSVSRISGPAYSGTARKEVSN